MAYFSNGTEGMVFDEQCYVCKYGDRPCPIAWVQLNYNYDQVDNSKEGETVAEKILNDLVKDDGTCQMFKEFEEDFRKPFVNPNQIKLEL